MPDNEELNTITTPEGLTEEDIEQESGWGWVGSPDHPDAKKSSDGISDLFELDDDPDTDDLISVDMEHDIIDGDLSDITDVTEEDVMGEDIYGQSPLDAPAEQKVKRIMPRGGIIRRPLPPPMTGIQGMGR